MNKLIRVSAFILCSGILISSCVNNGGGGQTKYEVNLTSEDLKYVPTTSSQLDDRAYMNEIDLLIDDTAKSIYNSLEFINLIKAIAWTESKWKHYFKEDNKYYVFLGDEGHSFGMMQIYDTYHGKHYVLQDNINYGADFAYDKYLIARGQNCPNGSNSGTDAIAIARRTYAMYNGGNNAICRDNDQRDNNLEDALSTLVWNNYL